MIGVFSVSKTTSRSNTSIKTSCCKAVAVAVTVRLLTSALRFRPRSSKAYRGCIRALELDTVVASSCSGVWALGHTLSYVVLKIL